MDNCVKCSEKDPNVKNNSCPVKMSDGRHFTDYRPRCIYNSQNRSIGSYELRQNMINNAEKMLEEKRRTMHQCGPCVDPFNIGTMLPEESIITCDENQCTVKMNDPNGVGQGRNYTNNNMSQAQTRFLEDRERESKMNMTCKNTPNPNYKF